MVDTLKVHNIYYKFITKSWLHIYRTEIILNDLVQHMKVIINISEILKH